MSVRIHELTTRVVLSTVTLALAFACGDDDADRAPNADPDAAMSDGAAGDGGSGDADGDGVSEGGSGGGGGEANEGGSDGLPDASSDATAEAGTADAGTVDAGDGNDSELEIAGEFHDEFGDWLFTDSTWELSYGGDVSAYSIESFSNQDDYLIALADEDNLYDASLFQKLMWIEDGDSLYTCTATGTGVETLDEALEATAGVDDLEAGCGGFPWSFIQPGLLADE